MSEEASKFESLQAYSQQFYYQMNSTIGISQQNFKPPHAQPMYWLKPPPPSNFEKSPPTNGGCAVPHVLNTCGKPWVCCGGVRGVLKEQTKKKIRGRGGVKPISMLTLWKIAWFFKQQIEFLLISCLAVAKSFMKKA